MPLIKPKKKNPFEASMPIDNPDVKVVTATFNEKPFFFGVGTSKQREVKGSGQAGFKEGVKGEYQSQKDLDWQLFYNLGALPSGFVPAEKLKNFMASTVAVTSGNASVYSPQTTFEETNPKKLTELENNIRSIKFSQAHLESMFKIKKKRKKRFQKTQEPCSS